MSCDCKETAEFFFNDTATTKIYTLSLHDALPISVGVLEFPGREVRKLRGGVAGVEVVEGKVVAEQGGVHAVGAAEVEDTVRAAPCPNRFQQGREESAAVLGGLVVEGTQGLEVPPGVRQVVDVVEVRLALLVVLGVGVRHPSRSSSRAPDGRALDVGDYSTRPFAAVRRRPYYLWRNLGEPAGKGGKRGARDPNSREHRPHAGCGLEPRH